MRSRETIENNDCGRGLDPQQPQELADTLAKERQFLPVDVPHPETATLGGVIATNGVLHDAVIEAIRSVGAEPTEDS